MKGLRFWAVFANLVSWIAIEKQEYVYAPPYVKKTYLPFLYLFLLFQKIKVPVIWNAVVCGLFTFV